MATNNPTHQRRKLATPNPPSISQTTAKKHTKHPTTTSTSTIYNLTNHFSMLHTNKHKDKPTNTHLQQAKTLSKSANLESSNNPRKLVVDEDIKEAKKKETKKKEEDDNNNKKIMVVKQPTLSVANNTGVGKRRSLSICDAKKELGNFLVTNCAKVVAADMPPFMQIHAVGFARKVKDSLEKFTSKNLALSLKKELDEAYGPAWHCIVGTSFGSFVTHSVGGFLYFSLDQKLYVLIFKTTVQRAD